MAENNGNIKEVLTLTNFLDNLKAIYDVVGDVDVTITHDAGDDTDYMLSAHIRIDGV